VAARAVVDQDARPPFSPDGTRRRPTARRRLRRVALALVATGAALLLYAATIYFWHDPVTDVYARYQQHRLEIALERSFREDAVALGVGETAANAPRAQDRLPELGVAAKRRGVAAQARAARADLEQGQPLGRLVIPELGIDPVFVHGTRWGADLSRGPGHYERSSLPGLDKVVAIAGHRTTFGAPFRHIDRLGTGDVITVQVAYGTFHYRVFAHEIVGSDDWSILRERGFETLVLSACHPLYSSSHRWIVYARLASVERSPVGSYALPAGRQHSVTS
jgi:sortase A